MGTHSWSTVGVLVGAVAIAACQSVGLSASNEPARTAPSSLPVAKPRASATAAAPVVSADVGANGAAVGVSADRSPTFPQGVAIGAVDGEHALLWARAPGRRWLHAEVRGGTRTARLRAPVEAGRDDTARLSLPVLESGARHRVTVWAGEERSEPTQDAVAAEFLAPPAADADGPVRLAWGGDIGGQNVCRDAKEGYPIFDTLARGRYDLFVALGDMIYGDGVCTGVGKYGNTQVPGDFPASSTLAHFHAHWRYNRAEDGHRRLLGSTTFLPIWDDHEVLNDFGPTRDTAPGAPGTRLLPLGLQAFYDYNPIAEQPSGKKLYRQLRWGKQLELFVLDTRQYRDAPERADTAAAGKSLLGAAQRQWLIDGLTHSTARWKVVVSSVPLSLPTGSATARDGWGDTSEKTGYLREALAVLEPVAAAKVTGLLFITADVHYGAVFRYRPPLRSGTLLLHEVASGPLHAGVFADTHFDTRLGAERVALFAPKNPFALVSYEEAKRWFSFGELAIERTGALTVTLRGVDGRAVSELKLD